MQDSRQWSHNIMGPSHCTCNCLPQWATKWKVLKMHKCSVTGTTGPGGQRFTRGCPHILVLPGSLKGAPPSCDWHNKETFCYVSWCMLILSRKVNRFCEVPWENKEITVHVGTLLYFVMFLSKQPACYTVIKGKYRRGATLRMSFRQYTLWSLLECSHCWPILSYSKSSN